MPRPLAWLALSLGAIVSFLVAGWHAYAWGYIPPRDMIPRTFAFAFSVRFMIDALFLSIGLVFLGQALFSEKT